MAIKYRELMKEYEVTLENKDNVLDKAFVSKAVDFEEKLKNNELTDDEIIAADNELVDLFNTLHQFAEEESEELKKANHKAIVNEAKVAIAEAGTIEDLAILREKYNVLPEVHPMIDQKIEKLTAKSQKDKDEQTKKIIEAGKKEITAARYDDLQAMGDKYKDYPELVAIINKRHNDEKPGNDDEKLRQTLLSKKEWSYPDLKALGINPTGNDMKVAGVKLEKEFLFAIYSVRK